LFVFVDDRLMFLLRKGLKFGTYRLVAVLYFNLMTNIERQNKYALAYNSVINKGYAYDV